MVLVIVASTKVSLSVLTPRPPSQPRPDDEPDVEALEALIEEARRRARRRRRGYAALLVAAAAALLGYFGFNNGGGSAHSQVARDGSQVAPSAPSQGEPAGLQLAAGIEGGSIRALAVDPQSPDTVFAATNRAGLFKSNDAGGSWHSVGMPLSATPIVSLAIAPADPRTVYAGTGGGVFKTTDGGATWHAANDGLFLANESAYEHEWRLSEGYVQTLVVDPRDPETVYAGTHQRGVFKSTNGGASWQRVNPAAVRSLILDPNDRETLYVAADGVENATTRGIVKSTDGGSTWRAAGPGREDGSLAGDSQLLAIDPQHSQTLYARRDAGLFKSKDGGSTWRVWPVRPALDVLVLAIDPLDSKTLYAGTDGGIFKSTDGGRSWTVLHAGREARGWNEVLVLDPSNPATLYAGSENGVLKSTDSGRSWEVSAAGMTAAGVDEIAAPTRGSAYALVSPQGLFKRTHHGWRRVFTGPPAAALTVLAVDPQRPETLYVATDDGRILGTSDGGHEWRGLQSTPIPKTAEITALAVDPRNSRTLYVGTADYSTGYDWKSIYKSSDGGATWRRLQQDGVGEPIAQLSSLAIDPRNPKTLHAAGVFYFKSDDGGATWTTPSVTQFDDVDALALDPSEPTTMYVGTDASVFKSTNGGANWRDLNVSFVWENHPVNAFVVNPHARQTVYAGTDDGLFLSVDGGENWRRYEGGDLLARGIHDLAVDPSGSMLYIGGTVGVFELSLAGR
jgi:photosystem II stability/assembly factor-like uncharacterized protein